MIYNVFNPLLKAKKEEKKNKAYCITDELVVCK